MEAIKDLLKFNKPEKPVYPFQEVCSKLARLSGLKFGVILALWNKKGNEIYRYLSEIEQGEIKNVKAYLLWNLSNNKNEIRTHNSQRI